MYLNAVTCPFHTGPSPRLKLKLDGKSLDDFAPASLSHSTSLKSGGSGSLRLGGSKKFGTSNSLGSFSAMDTSSFWLLVQVRPRSGVTWGPGPARKGFAQQQG